MSVTMPTKPLDGRTLYEQVRIVAKMWGWHYDAAHCAANAAVDMCDDNSPCKTMEELKSVVREVLRTDLRFDY